LEEEDSVFGGDIQKGAEIRLGLLDDGEELLTAVAHLHNAHAGSAPVVELGLGLEEDVLRQDGGPGGEVEDPILGLGRRVGQWALILGLGCGGGAFD